MSSNKDLKAEALLLAKNLGVDLDFKGLNNVKLVELVSDLKVKIKDRDTVTQLDKPPAPPEPLNDDAGDDSKEDKQPEPVVTVVANYPYSVAPGKAITCAKGMLSPGAEIRADWLGGGEKSLHNLVEKGYVIKG